MDIDLKNNLNKNQGIKDTHTAQNSLANQNTSEFKNLSSKYGFIS